MGVSAFSVSDQWPWRFLLRMVGIWSSRWGGRQGLILSYRRVLGKLGCLWWRRRVKKWRKQSCQCQERVFERRLAHHLKFSAPQIAVFSWTSLLSYCIPFGCDGGLPLPVCKRMAAKALYWSSTAMVAKIWMINSVSDNTMWFCKKNLDLLQLDKNRFLSTAYLDNKCKHYTWLMFLIQEMLIIMAVKDKKKSSVPCIQQVPRHKK